MHGSVPLPTTQRLRRNRKLALAVSITTALVLFDAAPARAAEDVWISGASNGFWNVGSNWLDGTAPVPTADLTLRFAPVGSTAVTANNDSLGTTQVNRIFFENNRGGAVSLVGNSLTLTGNNPSIEIQAIGDASIAMPITLASASGVTRIGGTGFGDLTLSGVISGGNPPQGLVIAGQSPSYRIQLIRLAASGVFAGGLTLESGNLVVGSGSLGSGPFVIKSGSLQFGGPAGAVVSNPTSLESDLLITGANNATFQGVISSATSGTGLLFRTNTTNPMLTLNAASTYNGPTRIDFGPTSSLPYLDAGVLRLTGTNGSIRNSSMIDIRSNGTLQLEAVSTGAVNRIGDSTPVMLTGGRLLFNTPSAMVSQAETAGPLSAAGHSSVSVVPSSSSGASLTFTSLTRTDRGTILFRGQNLGGAAGPNTANVLFNTAPTGLIGGGGTGLETSILPYVIGDSSAIGMGSGFVTYSPASGVRLLDVATEYSGSLPAAAVTHNVRLTSNATNNSVATINSLLLAGGSVDGNGSLNITSGALLASTPSSIQNSLNFGATDGKIFALGDLTVGGQIHGSGGLTKSGDSELILTAASNPFTGPLTINSGTIAFTETAQLGADSSAIVLNGQNAGLNYVGTGTRTLSRSLSLTSGYALIESTGGGNLEIAGSITGAGGLRVAGRNGTTVVITGNNTNIGPVYIEGRVSINSDAALGSGDLLIAGTITLAGDWNTSRNIRILNATVDTAGFNAVWNGVLLNDGTLTKSGAGTLTISNAAPQNQPMISRGGTLRLNGLTPVTLNTLATTGDGQFLLDRLATATADQIADNSFVSLAGGGLSLTGNATSAVTEKFGTMAVHAPSAVTMATPGNFGNTLIASDIQLTSGHLLVRGEHLGGAASGPYSRLVFSTAPASLGSILKDIYAEDLTSGGAVSFATYNTSSDAAGVIGVRSLTPAELTTGSSIQNSANGGTTPVNANFVAGAGTTAGGNGNTVHSLTLENGGNLTLVAGQTLSVTAARVLIRPGAASASINGGTLDFGAEAGSIANFGDLQLSSVVAGTGGFKIAGPGIVTLRAVPTNSGGFAVSSGKLRIANPSLLSAQSLTVDTYGTFDLNGADTNLGGIAGRGVVELTGKTLILGGTGADFTSENVFRGPGLVRIIDGGNPMATRTLDGTVEGNAVISLESGRFRFSQFGGPDSRVEFNGGSIYQGHLHGTVTAPVVLNQSVIMRGRGALTIAETASISGAGGVTVESGSFSIDTRAQYTGETRASFGYSEGGLTSGNIMIGDSYGALVGTSGLYLEAGTSLLLQDTIRFRGPAGGRIADSIPVNLRSADVTLLGNNSLDTEETIGVVSGAGGSSITVRHGTTASASLTVAALQRMERGTFQFGGANLGGMSGTYADRIFLNTAPSGFVGGGGTGPETSILPYAFWSPFVGVGEFVTYSPSTGVRPLNSTADYANSIDAASSTANVAVSSEQILSGPRTINSLLLRSDAANIKGSGPLAVSSGAILSVALTPEISVPLAFGSVEASFHTAGSLTVSGAIQGTGGLTKSGSGTLSLSGVNVFTGSLTINEGIVAFSSLENLGPDSSEIALYNGGLAYGGQAPLNWTRPVRLNGSLATFGTRDVSPAAGTLTLDTSITGSSSLAYVGNVRIAANQAYTGATEVRGTLTIPSDAVLGAIPRIILGGTLKLDGPWTTSRSMTVNGSGSVDTSGFDATITGAIEGESGTFEKRGAGRLTIEDARLFKGSGVVSAGTLVINSTDAVTNYTVNAGGVLAGKGQTSAPVAVSGTLAPGDSVGMLSTGPLSLLGGSTLALEIASSALFDRVNVAGEVSLKDSVNLSLSVLSGFDAAAGTLFTVIENDGADPVVFNNGGRLFYQGNPLDEGERFVAGTYEFQISYAGGTGNDVTLSFVPEPSSAALLAAGALGLLRRRRSRSQGKN